MFETVIAVVYGMSLWLLMCIALLVVVLVTITHLDRSSYGARKSNLSLWAAFFILTTVLYILNKDTFLQAQGQYVFDYKWFIGSWLVIGLIYSCIELFIRVKEASDKFASLFSTRLISYSGDGQGGEVVTTNMKKFLSDFMDGTLTIKNKELFKTVQQKFNDYMNTVEYEFPRNILNFSLDNSLKMDVSISKKTLYMALPGWILLWPAFMISMVFRKILVRLFEVIGDIMAKYFNGIVKRIFRNAMSSSSK